jgi:hypothetical protein
MAALAPSAAEVVRFAGGWLFDQGMAGWEVSVLTRDHSDQRALRILGARAHDLDATLASPVVQGSCLQAIAVWANLYDSDARVRRMVRTVLEAGPAELRLWGDTRSADRGAHLVHHRLSIAARAFKAQALAAARVRPEASADPEVFHSLTPRRPGWAETGHRRGLTDVGRCGPA